MDWQPIETAPLREKIKLRGANFEAVGVLTETSYALEDFEMRGSGTMNRQSFTHWAPTHSPQSSGRAR